MKPTLVIVFISMMLLIGFMYNCVQNQSAELAANKSQILDMAYQLERLEAMLPGLELARNNTQLKVKTKPGLVERLRKKIAELKESNKKLEEQNKIFAFEVNNMSGVLSQTEARFEAFRGVSKRETELLDTQIKELEAENTDLRELVKTLANKNGRR